MGKLQGLVAEGQGGSAGLRMAVLRVATDGISFLRADGEGHIHLPFSTLKMSAARGGHHHWILQGRSHFPIIYIREEHSKELLLKHAPADISRRLESLQQVARSGASRFVFVSLVILILFAFLTTLASWRFPSISRFVLRHLPASVEQMVGSAALHSYTRDLELSAYEGEAGFVDDSTIQNGVARIADAVLGDKGDLGQLEVSVFNLDDADAIAAPGAGIVIYSGLIAQAETPEEVAGVLAHEAEHVMLGHSFENIASRAGSWTGFGALGTLIGFHNRWSTQLAKDLITGSYSVAQEKEADIECLRLLARRGISPRGFYSFLGKSNSQLGIEGISLGFWLTHPTNLQRVNELQRQAMTLDWSKQKPLPRANWAEIRQRASTISRRMASRSSVDKIGIYG